MTGPDYALVLNAGSSSLKFSAFTRPGGESWRLEARGQVGGIGTAPRLTVRDGAGRPLAVQGLERTVRDLPDAFESLAAWLRERYHGARLVGVGHRVVHGGSRCGPSLVTRKLVEDLRALVPFAPLHQPYNLAGIEAAWRYLPEVPQVACFDTSFHRGAPGRATLVPLPLEIRRAGIQRYGFHGISYEYVASVLPRVAPDIAGGRVVVAHLGSGASMCALRAGQSVDHTFGFSALDGLCMGTRPGALDPGVVLYLFQGLGLSAQEVEALLYTRSGLLGISGIASDMRELLASTEPAAELAVEYFVYRAAREVGALAAVLGGIDGLVFTGGIGENSAEIRHHICAASAWLGVQVDVDANLRGGPRISRPRSPVAAWVVRTDEELTIARHTGRLLGLLEARA
jgi:acetate kinase